MRGFVSALCAAMGLLAIPAAAKEVHGQVDAFKTPGVSMAWSVVSAAGIVSSAGTVMAL